LFLPKVNQETSSDTEKISQIFSEVNGIEIPVILSSIQGPYAFIYLDIQNHHLYFGRDRLGRHSLLWSSDCEGGLVLTSVGKRNALNLKEVPAIGIFRINMNSGEFLMACTFILFKYISL
jgi:asparagine synthetase B (glutamine-hydrolysing)